MATVPNKDGVGGIDSHIPKIIFAALALANIFTAPQTINAGVTTVNDPALSISQTWNAGGVTFTGFKVNITDTASASASLLMDLQVGGNSVLSLRKDSRLLVGSAGSIGGGIVMESANRLGILAGTSQVVSVRSGGIVQPSTGTLCWTSGVVGGTEDLFLRRDAANILAQRNGATAQTFRVYNTYTDGSNNERVEITTGPTHFIQSVAVGTGTLRDLVIGTSTGSATLALMTGATRRFSVGGSTGHLTPHADNTYDFGAATHMLRNFFIAGYARFAPTTVAALPAAATAGAGARMVVSDASAPTFGATVAGGGAVVTPVYSDGTNWKVG